MRGIEHLIPQAQDMCNKFVELCESRGLKVKITDTLRSKEEQDALYNQGRTTAGSIVTNCKYPNSMHNWGVAWDFCRNDGSGAYNESGRWFEKVGECAVELGLIWGGNFKSFVDKPHVQLAQWGSTPSQLKAKYGTPEEFWKSYKPSEVVAVIQDKHWIKLQKGDRHWQVRILQCFLFEDANECDGIFGDRTDKAVREYQSGKNIAVDGIVGKNTWTKLIEDFGWVIM